MEKGKENKEVLKKEIKTSDDLKLEAINLRNKELQDALKEIQEICNKYQCGLDADFQVSKKGIVPRVFLVDLK